VPNSRLSDPTLIDRAAAGLRVAMPTVLAVSLLLCASTGFADESPPSATPEATAKPEFAIPAIDLQKLSARSVSVIDIIVRGHSVRLMEKLSRETDAASTVKLEIERRVDVQLATAVGKVRGTTD
jgi:hypothetical protein